ncbi:class F sortase [Christensenellaceae bacterium OttesenSCG-928-M15]|nr:class F sortase [Christensenellaceae bacterium OttesenSCG-928-M15]
MDDKKMYDNENMKEKTPDQAETDAGQDKKLTKEELKNARQERKKKEPLRLKIMWWVVYALIAALMGTGIYMIVRQSVIIPETPYEAPPELIVAQNTPTPAPAPSATAEAASPEPTAEPEPEPAPDEELPPSTISFTKPELTCGVVEVGIEDGTIGTVNSATLAAWYNGSAMPGDDGNCIINGHVSWRGDKGVFAYLKSMSIGEEVVIKRADDSYVYYRATLIEEHPYDDFPQEFLKTGGETRLTLITCKGDYDRDAGTSLTRVVVECEQVGIVEGQGTDEQ